jgi:N-acetylneuraminic acid mutarotase
MCGKEEGLFKPWREEGHYFSVTKSWKIKKDVPFGPYF